MRRVVDFFSKNGVLLSFIVFGAMMYSTIFTDISNAHVWLLVALQAVLLWFDTFVVLANRQTKVVREQGWKYAFSKFIPVRYQATYWVSNSDPVATEYKEHSKWWQWRDKIYLWKMTRLTEDLPAWKYPPNPFVPKAENSNSNGRFPKGSGATDE